MKLTGNTRGLTVVELAVTLLVMSMLIAMALPSLKKIYASYSLQAAARHIQQDIRSLCQEALVRETADYRIVFYNYREFYYVYGPGKPRKVTMPPGVDLVDTNFDTSYISDQINISAKGKPTRGGHVTLRSKLTGELTHVIVAAVTGRTRIGERLPASDHDY